ncbi:MAG: hypothetical protein K5668_02235 [Lachnospiraceae bacterium]|nr:hypothetical protein [Lachnospiraceae bacterium]
MRAVVLKIKENKAAVLLKDGSLCHIEDKGYEQGTVLELLENEYAGEKAAESVKKRSAILFHRRFTYSAAACLATLMLSGAMVSYACPVRTVPASSGTSVSLGVNIYGKVVEINSTDENEEKILRGLEEDLAGKDVAYVSNLIHDTIDSNNEKESVEEPAEDNMDTALQPSEQPPVELHETVPSYEIPSEEEALPDSDPAESNTEDTIPDERENKDADEKKEAAKQPDEKKPETPAENRQDNRNPGIVEPPSDILQDSNGTQVPSVIPNYSPENVPSAPDNGGSNPPGNDNDRFDDGGNSPDAGNPPDGGGGNPPDTVNPPDGGGNETHDGGNPGDNGSRTDSGDHGRDGGHGGGGRSGGPPAAIR